MEKCSFCSGSWDPSSLHTCCSHASPLRQLTLHAEPLGRGNSLLLSSQEGKGCKKAIQFGLQFSLETTLADLEIQKDKPQRPSSISELLQKLKCEECGEEKNFILLIEEFKWHNMDFCPSLPNNCNSTNNNNSVQKSPAGWLLLPDKSHECIRGCDLWCKRAFCWLINYYCLWSAFFYFFFLFPPVLKPIHKFYSCHIKSK